MLAGTILLLGTAGGFVGVYYGIRHSSAELTEPPEIPTVNLEGTDPAIAKLVREARSILEKSPHSAIQWGRYAMVLHAHGFADAAHISYDAAARLDPKNPLWPYLEGDLCQPSSGGSEAALPFFERAAQLSGTHTLARLRMAEALLELGRLDQAKQEFLAVLAIQKQDPQAQLGLARVAVARRAYLEALPYLKTATGNPRVQNSACALLASVYDQLGDHDAAEQSRLRLTKLPPDEPRPDDPANQISFMEVGIRAELTRANKLREENRTEELLALVEELAHRYPESFEAWTALCNTYGMAGNPAGAERAARKASQLAPKNSAAWLSLGNVLIWQRRYKDALEPLQKSIELNPQNRQAYFSLGKCRRELGDATGAAEAFERSGIAEDQPPGSPGSVKKP